MYLMPQSAALPFSRGRVPTSARRRVRFLGAATPAAADAVSQLLQQTGHSAEYAKFCGSGSSKWLSSPVPGGCPVNQYAACAYWAQSIASRYLCWPTPAPWLAGGSGSGAKAAGILRAAGGTTAALTTSTAAMPALISTSVAVPIIGAALVGVAAIIGIFSAHHAKAQAAQANAIAAAVPAANAALQALDQQLAAGQISLGDAATALDQLSAQVSQAMKQGTSYKHGDALWVVDIAMQLVAAARKKDLQAQAAAPAAAGAISIGGSVVPAWAVLAGGGLIAWLLLS